jgi:transposase
MIVIGIDSHKRTHTAVAVDGNGRRLAETTVAATGDGHLELVRWAGRFGPRRYALEDTRHLSRRLSTDLLRAGEAVAWVPTRLMAESRRHGREPGKSDPIDALAVARAALANPDLPVATLDGEERELRLLVDHREDLVAERTRAINRLRWHLHELDPGTEPSARSLNRLVALDALAMRLAPLPGTVARIARELVARVRDLTRSITGLERELARLVATVAPNLMELPGCGALSAAKLVGQVARIGRFTSAAAFARHNGSAPLPVWSGNQVRHRLSRKGDRQVNVVLHRIAITQMRLGDRGRAYYDHRRAAGDSKAEAIRALRRRISDEVYRRMRHDEHLRAATRAPLAAAA